MSTIVHAGGGNPAIAEIWMSQGSWKVESIVTADCNKNYYSVTEGKKNKISTMDFPFVWSKYSGTHSISFTPNVEKIHCVILPYCQSTTVSIVSSTAEYEKIGEYKSDVKSATGSVEGSQTGFELVFKNMTVGQSYSITLSFSRQAILGIIMIVYDD